MFFCFIVLPQHFELYFVIVFALITAFQSIKTHSNVSWLVNVNTESCFFMSLVCKYIFVGYDSNVTMSCLPIGILKDDH